MVTLFSDAYNLDNIAPEYQLVLNLFHKIFCSETVASSERIPSDCEMDALLEITANFSRTCSPSDPNIEDIARVSVEPH